MRSAVVPKCAIDSSAHREALGRVGVHVQRQAGIHGDPSGGAFSICLSEGYEDNVDNGETMYVHLSYPRFVPNVRRMKHLCWLR